MAKPADSVDVSIHSQLIPVPRMSVPMPEVVVVTGVQPPTATDMVSPPRIKAGIGVAYAPDLWLTYPGTSV